MPTEADYWNSLARFGVDAAVIDPLDSRGVKNAYITGLRTKVLLDALSMLPKGATVLDLGCGTGALLRDLAAAGHAAIGLDIAQKLVRDSRSRFGGLPPPAAVYDGHRFPLPDACLDAVCTYVVLNHIVEDEALLRVLTEVARVLRPSARLLAIEQIRWHSRLEPRRHTHRRSSQHWQQLFNAAGLVTAPATVLRYGHNPLIYPIRYGLVPRQWLPQLARLEMRFASMHGAPRLDYADTLFVAQKPDE